MLIMPTRCANVDQRFPFQQSHPNELLLDLNLFLVGMPVELVAVRLDGEDGRGHALGSQGVSEVWAEASPSGTAEFPNMRFGIGAGNEHTLEEVGQRFSVTRERIRLEQIETD